jgi:hypothetical protein
LAEKAGEQLAQMDVEKQRAIAMEDYDLAEDIKVNPLHHSPFCFFRIVSGFAR